MKILLFLCLLLIAPTAQAQAREDGATLLNIPLSGSLQNPVFSPDGSAILFTRFRRGYNRGAADLYIFDLATGSLRALVSDGSTNVNLPGAAWNARGNAIVFSSTRGEHDEIYMISASGQPGQEVAVTQRQNLQAFEPSFSADGRWLVFESHEVDNDEGVVTKLRLGTADYTNLTAEGAVIKQPNWSPTGNLILYQQLNGDNWSIWTMRPDGSHAQRVSPANISATDASFSADGRSIIFSGETAETTRASLFTLALGSGRLQRLTNSRRYDGAPSFSPDGRLVVFESTPRDPDHSRGSQLWIITR